MINVHETAINETCHGFKFLLPWYTHVCMDTCVCESQKSIVAPCWMAFHVFQRVGVLISLRQSLLPSLNEVAGLLSPPSGTGIIGGYH